MSSLMPDVRPRRKGGATRSFSRSGWQQPLDVTDRFMAHSSGAQGRMGQPVAKRGHVPFGSRESHVGAEVVAHTAAWRWHE